MAVQLFLAIECELLESFICTVINLHGSACKQLCVRWRVIGDPRPGLSSQCFDQGPQGPCYSWEHQVFTCQSHLALLFLCTEHIHWLVVFLVNISGPAGADGVGEEDVALHTSYSCPGLDCHPKGEGAPRPCKQTRIQSPSGLALALEFPLSAW